MGMDERKPDQLQSVMKSKEGMPQTVNEQRHRHDTTISQILPFNGGILMSNTIRTIV